MHPLKEVFWVFFKLGCVAFGGPAAHIALMEAEVVTKRKWLSAQEFLDLVGGTNLIPGPNSTEMTMHCGFHRAGRAGLFVGGFAFIFPATLITALVAWLYVEYGSLPEVQPFVQGIKPAVLSVILGAVVKLGKKAIKSVQLGIMGAVVVLACLLGVSEIQAILITGLVGGLLLYFNARNKLSILSPLWLSVLPKTAPLTLTTQGIFLSFLKVGAILYGSGYVLFAYLDAELVHRGILTTEQLLDAIAMGQFTPGPVLSTATFIGYQLNGFSGAIAATAGIFLPSFLFVLISHPFLPKMRESKFWKHFLNAVNVGAVGVMVAVLAEMSLAAASDWRSISIAIAGLAYQFGAKKPNPIWTILGGSILGFVLFYLT